MNKTPLFAEFWDAYGLKRNKRRTEPVWNRLTARDKRAAIAGISAYRNSCTRQGIAMMYPHNYLRDRRWEDDDVSQAPVSGFRFQASSNKQEAPCNNSLFEGMGEW